MATAMATALSNITAKAKTAWPIRAGKTATIPSSMPMAGWPPAPIALCEVQAYVYAAKQGAAVMARMLGEHARADAAGRCRRARCASASRRHSGARNWASYAIALDGDKKPCRVRTSNAGQVLFCGIASPDRAARLAETLMTPEMFSGWGVRTVASDAPRYNPMSYHDGSVWPHDNALIALGPWPLWLQARRGRHFRRAVRRLQPYGADALSRTVLRLSPPPRHRAHALSGRLPAPGLGQRRAVSRCWKPVWALSATMQRREIRFHNPLLPRFLEEIRIRNLTLDGASADLRLRRNGEGTEVAILAQQRRYFHSDRAMRGTVRPKAIEMVRRTISSDQCLALGRAAGASALPKRALSVAARYMPGQNDHRNKPESRRRNGAAPKIWN